MSRASAGTMPPCSLQAKVASPCSPFRAAEIRCNRGGHVCTLLMPAHPLHGSPSGVVGTVTPLIDLWLDERRLPVHMRAVPKPGERSAATYTMSQEVTAPASGARATTRTVSPGIPSTR